jgi:3-hydroxyisobutyrate dehydrogenase-like beta-hydroxyacid dehydrogenase
MDATSTSCDRILTRTLRDRAMTERIGFVGLGQMGGRIAKRLLASGHPVVVWDRTIAKALALEAGGADVAESPVDLSARCDIVLGCLLDDVAVDQVYTGPRGMLAAARPEQVFVEHGTFSPARARALRESAAAKGAEFLDAPVSGGPEGAESGDLVTMIGGAHSAIGRVEPVLRAYSRDVTHVGHSGAGLELKLVNQLLVSVNLAGVAEAAALLQRMKIPLDVALPVLSGGWAASTMLSRSLPRAMTSDFTSEGATIGGFVHVQDLVNGACSAVGLETPMMDAARGVFDEAAERSLSLLDPSALIELYS